MPRYGIHIPFDGISLADHRPIYEELAELGYSDMWTSEGSGPDGFSPLAMAAAWAPTVHLGTAIVPVFTRGPALLAMSAAAMAEAAPGRFTLGVGTSSNLIVEGWNGIPFDEPFRRTRDVVHFLKEALQGGKVDLETESFTVRGFQLKRPPEVVPPILIAALRPGMLRLAGREGDGAIINWLSADDVATVAPYVGPGKQIVARIFVCPSTDAEAVRFAARFAIAAYLNVPVYAAFHEWLGRGPMLQGMWDAWKAGDRKAALAAIPDELVDELFVHGSPDTCREHIARYVANGVTTPIISIFDGGVDFRTAMRDLAPK
jgi:probable F420-dependent oxidoreductase